MVISNANTFAKTICSICYEDLKPIVEDLQAISICGHVFHELCLQQWFEYCSNSKKCTCPVCKQSCKGSNAARLYFQSLGDQNESFLSQKVTGCKEDPELLRGEVNRLEIKVNGLSSNLETQGKEIKQLNDELCICNEQLKKEVNLKNDAIGQKSLIQQLLHSKSQELDTVKSECLKLQDRNLALAKELAALKLMSDLNLDEDEILKFASYGNEAKSKDTIDILRKSLVIRNKSYKELMAKCNELGRGEARYSNKLEKAKEKINKLKIRIQELEMIVEVKDNEALRALKSSKKIHCKDVTLDGINDSSNAFSTSAFISEEKEKRLKFTMKHDRTADFNSDQGNFNIISDVVSNSNKEWTCNVALNKERHASITTEKIASELHVLLSDTDSKHPINGDVKSTISKLEEVPGNNSKPKMNGTTNSGEPFSARTHVSSDEDIALAASTDDEVILLDDVKDVRPVLNIRKESPSAVPLSKPGDICFSSGLLGPDGTNRYLGKWCKRSRSNEQAVLQSTSASRGDLIVVGSDGRGGRVKVLRSLTESSLAGDSKESSPAAKRCKYGAKASNLQSQGCLQIEHFFERATR